MDMIDTPFHTTPFINLQLEDGSENCKPGQRPSRERVSLFMSILNVVKNGTGIGMLSLPQAAAADTGIGASLVIVAVVCFLSAWSFALVGCACIAHDGISSKSIGDFPSLWQCSVGEGSIARIDALFMVFAVGTCLVYVPTLHVFLRPVLVSVGVPVADLGMELKIVLGVVVWLMCQISNVEAMAWSSAIGTCAVALCLAIAIARLADGSYTPGGTYYGEGLHNPQDRPEFWAIGPSAAVLGLRLCFGVNCHYNVPRYYCNVDSPSPIRLCLMAAGGYLGIAVVYATMIVCGILTFGRSVDVPMLSSYAVGDSWALVARWMCTIAVLTLIPLVFTNIREPGGRLVAAVFGGDPTSSKTQNRATRYLSLLVAVLGVMLDDIGFLISLMGAFVSSLMTWILPALIIRHCRKEFLKESSGSCWPLLFQSSFKFFLVLGALQITYGLGYTFGLC